jgi:hypothetical protein
MTQVRAHFDQKGEAVFTAGKLLKGEEGLKIEKKS